MTRAADVSIQAVSPLFKAAASAARATPASKRMAVNRHAIVCIQKTGLRTLISLLLLWSCLRLGTDSGAPY